MLLAIVAGLAAPNVHNLPTTVTVFGICKASPAARGISTQTARRRLNLRHFGWRVSGCSRRAPSSSQGADKSRIPIVKTYRFDSVDSARERRESESNRRTRLCRPLHDHSAIPPETGAAAWFGAAGKRKGELALRSPRKIWSGKRVSNSRPQPWQGCALPTELFPRRVRIIASGHPGSSVPSLTQRRRRRHPRRTRCSSS